MNINFASRKWIGCVLFVIFVLYALTLWYGWAYTIWWIDVVLHVLGGVWVAQIFFFLKNHYVPRIHTEIPWLLYLSFALGFVMLVGVAWEWFEYILDAVFFTERFGLRQQLGLADTLGDLVADTVGALFVAISMLVRERKHDTLS